MEREKLVQEGSQTPSKHIQPKKTVSKDLHTNVSEHDHHEPSLREHPSSFATGGVHQLVCMLRAQVHEGA